MTVTIFPLADKGSVAVMTLPAMEAAGAAVVTATWNVWPAEELTLPTTVATGLADAATYTSHNPPVTEWNTRTEHQNGYDDNGQRFMEAVVCLWYSTGRVGPLVKMALLWAEGFWESSFVSFFLF